MFSKPDIVDILPIRSSVYKVMGAHRVVFGGGRNCVHISIILNRGIHYN